ncbi:TATA element modulatory factor, putative [Babesia ovata]|uniref:TATA element modulatory factor, putative n=1 Tax=Babesia ovata TaxID=189622 RepID=A0A2H6KCC3_9APIC|nr:TATA element modulatory factor, putative [Babesia ovata]GBE60646.1 TATA element modulatory factor, putative [Babesia ovata]
MERTESADSSSTLYKVMVNRKIVEKVQMNMHTHSAPSPIAHSGAACSNRAADCDELDEIERLTRENRLLEQKYQDTFEALDKVRQTALEASERALSREFRIAFLEKALHGCEVSLNEAKDALHEHDKGIQKVKRETQKELGVLQSQVERLNAMVVEKDARILELINDLTRQRNTVNELTQRKSDLLKQLKDMCEKLNTVVWESNQREKLLNNVESELRKREMERQAAFLTEVTRSKRLLVGIKVKENMLNQMISTKNKKISELEQNVQKLVAKISRISGVFNDINFNVETPIALTTCDNQCSQVECNLASPCNVQLLSGRAKVLL